MKEPVSKAFWNPVLSVFALMGRILFQPYTTSYKSYISLQNRLGNSTLIGFLPDSQIWLFRGGTLDEHLVKEIYMNDGYERFFSPKNGDIVVDAGAHIGVFTLKAAKQVGDKGKVLAFEPEPSNFRFLIRNVRANNLHNVHAFQVALGETKSFAPLYIAQQSLMHSLCRDLLDANATSISIPIWALDDILKLFSISFVDFLKIDVEGYEMKVLKGARQTLNRSAAKISVSAYHYEKEAIEVQRYLNSLGYTTKVCSTTWPIVYAWRSSRKGA